jgi:N-acetylmuramoyl-L-alanine amidase
MPVGDFGYVPKVRMPVIDAPPTSADPATYYAQLGLTVAVSSPDATNKSVEVTVSAATPPDTRLFAPLCGSLSYVPAGQATPLTNSFVAPAGGALHLHVWLMDVFKMSRDSPVAARDMFFTGFDPAQTDLAVKLLLDHFDATQLGGLWATQNSGPPPSNPVTLRDDCFTYFKAGNLAILVKSGAVIGRLPLTVVQTQIQTSVTIAANGLGGEFISPIRTIRSLPWFDRMMIPPHMDQHPLYLSVRKSVVIDPGHGGEEDVFNDPVQKKGRSSHNNASGTTSDNQLILEKDKTLEVGQRCKPILERYGFQAILTRTGNNNLTLNERGLVAAAINAPAFVSIHFNAPKLLTDIAQGTETLCDTDYTDHNVNCANLARIVQRFMVGATGYADRNASWANGVKTQGLGVLRSPPQSAVTACCLTEISFIYSTHNSIEIDRLQTASYLDSLALALCKAIEEYISTWDD